jgi:hypothetical protein
MRFLALLVGFLFASAANAQQPFGNFDSQTPLITLTAAGAGTTNSADLYNPYGKGVVLGINISAKTGTIAVVVNIQGKDAVSSQYYTICSSASLTSAAFTTLTTYPGMSPLVANVSCAAPLPATWRAQVVSGTGSTPAVTLTIGASVIE